MPGKPLLTYTIVGFTRGLFGRQSVTIRCDDHSSRNKSWGPQRFHAGDLVDSISDRHARSQIIVAQVGETSAVIITTACISTASGTYGIGGTITITEEDEGVVEQAAAIVDAMLALPLPAGDS